MIVSDINLLLYAYDSESPLHVKAAAWWQACLSGAELVGLPLVVLFGFVRIGTNSRVFANPLTCNEAVSHIRSWLNQPSVQVLEAGPNHVEAVLNLLETLGTAGNLVTDAQIAALTIQYNGTLHTTDSHFLRFPGLRWFNPITGASHSSVRKSHPGKSQD
jgi:toxin-antitoxin system PIN domain toxin